VIAVVDIDGVLADPSHRTRHLSSTPKDWDAFFAEVGGDGLLEHGRALLLELAAEHEVVLLSGRPESARADTEDWLARHEIAVSRVVLRENADHRPAPVMKADLIRGIGGPDDIVVVVDDDASVVAGLSAVGYRTQRFW
jgi:hypothetical protein